MMKRLFHSPVGLVRCLSAFALIFPGLVFSQTNSGYLYNYNVTANSSTEWEMPVEALELGTAKGVIGGLLSPLYELGNPDAVESVLVDDLGTVNGLIGDIDSVNISNALDQVVTAFDMGTNQYVREGSAITDAKMYINMIIYDPISIGDGVIMPLTAFSGIGAPTAENSFMQFDMTGLSFDFGGLDEYQPFPTPLRVDIPLGITKMLYYISAVLLGFLSLQSAVGSFRILFDL